jgi:uncharacterized membrane protein YtjA (UPF0391 family)
LNHFQNLSGFSARLAQLQPQRGDWRSVARGVLVWVQTVGALPAAPDSTTRRHAMLRWALTFFIVALIAGLLGFAGIAGAASNIAILLFWVFVVLFVLSLLVNLVNGKSVRTP